ncbi:Uncharacterized protein BP5553_05671 [Venustampulla echinocandica]|uniref:Uncharacterized protein n=1 Tax=Venustampulla echinocandica TaxID=2656787 RepID=A0A370TLC7_9HELO|nr:Uncharacterized protein BP5553_05671 [Venustampulla echinocandica]RDL36319.1 Uncharacterized protein BP5553_05671 [Venustampulla echinocandica]
MSNKQKTYFLCPGWDFPVDSIQLGAILSNPNFPHKTITSAEDKNLIDTPIYVSHKYNFSDKFEKSKSHKYGFFAQFLQIFGLGGEASVLFEKGSIETYAFKHMKTEWFLPSESFAKASSELPRVASFFDRTDFEKPVYIITGLKVVQGASVTTNPKKSRTLQGKLGFDGTPIGVPVTIGPEAEHTKSIEGTTGFERSSPVVFAYQLSELWCKGGGEEPVLKDHTAGAMFELGDGKTTAEMETEISDGMGKALVDGREFVSVIDEDSAEDCVCILPTIPR